ncbi:MAG: aspartate aminotransferase family protein [Clostridia bacterium]|nr:aspartate aminotransferase family protein [Clostridia bacterium]
MMFTLGDVDGLSRKSVTELYKKYLNSGFVTLASLINFDKIYLKAEGSIITDEQGNRYIDFLGGYGALNVGHNHPEILQGLEKVKEKPNILQAGLNPYAAALASNLAVMNDGVLNRSFFCNSGAEAVEGALKMARAATGRTKIVYCKNSFHGKTFGALSVTGRKKYRECFNPLLPGCEEAAFGDIDELDDKLNKKDVAGFIVEPIQGEGGVLIPPEGYLKAARELCTLHGTLMIIDEIQTGLGRTGRMFAYEHDNIMPDIICLAKSLSGGIMPIGAFVTKDEIYHKAYGGMEKCLLHTSTFGGNTYSCAAGLAAIEVIYKENLIHEAKKKGEYLLEKLAVLKQKYDMVKDIRGKGLLLGIEFNNKTSRFLNALTKGNLDNISKEYFASLVAGKLLTEYGILTAYTLNNPNVIRIEPPLNISYKHLDRLVEALEGILKDNKGFIGMALGNVKNMVRT